MKRITIRRKTPEEVVKELLPNLEDVFSLGGSREEFYVKFKAAKIPSVALINSLKARLPEYEIIVEDVADEILYHEKRHKR